MSEEAQLALELFLKLGMFISAMGLIGTLLDFLTYSEDDETEDGDE